MRKKAQVTVFVIIGLVLLIGAGLYFFVFANNAGIEDAATELTNVVQVDSVETLIASCAQDIVKETEQEIMFSRYYFEQRNPAAISPDGLPYYYFAGKILLPDIDYIEAEYSNRIRPLVLDCIDNFDPIRDVISEEIVLNGEEYMTLYVVMAEDELRVKTSIDGQLVGASGAKDIPETVVSIPSKAGTFYRGVQLLLYPPIEEGQAFYEPAESYLAQKGITLYGRPSGDGIEMIFTMEEQELPENREYRLRLTFRLLGSFTTPLSWV